MLCLLYLYPDELGSCISRQVGFDLLVRSAAVKVHAFLQSESCHSNSPLVP